MLLTALQEQDSDLKYCSCTAETRSGTTLAMEVALLPTAEKAAFKEKFRVFLSFFYSTFPLSLGLLRPLECQELSLGTQRLMPPSS